MQGWVSVHRKISENWIWEDKPFSKGQAWIDILLNVNHAEAKVMIGNQLILVNPGERIWSIKDMSIKWGWSRTKTDSFLLALKKDMMIDIKKTTKYTIVTVLNWSLYQDIKERKDIKKTSKEHQQDINETSKEHQKNTNNNGNHADNGNKFIKPSLDMIKAYCLERNNNVDCEKWLNYYISNGWKVGKNNMKDWKAAVRTWEKNTDKSTCRKVADF